VDEERRLFYVGITRARRRLTLTRAASRTERRRAAECSPSRFLAEIDRDCLREVRRNIEPPSPEESRRRLREIVAGLGRGRPGSGEGEGK
jgi:DNA helicase-2/ATP-dependent DNA helicase PcrA